MTDGLHTQRTAAKHYTLCQISGFHCSVVEVFAFPGLYATLAGSSLLMFQGSLSVPFSRIKQSTKNARNRWKHCTYRVWCGHWLDLMEGKWAHFDEVKKIYFFQYIMGLQTKHFIMYETIQYAPIIQKLLHLHQNILSHV